MPIRFARTNDLNLVRSILTHPRLYPHLTSDFSPPAEDFYPNPDSTIHYMVIYDTDIMGIYTAHPIMSPVTWEVHHAILPSAWNRTAEIAEAFEAWLFSETPCETAIGFTPVCNRLAVRYAEKRMNRTGVIPSGYKKNGRLYDIIVFSKIKPVL